MASFQVQIHSPSFALLNLYICRMLPFFLSYDKKYRLLVVCVCVCARVRAMVRLMDDYAYLRFAVSVVSRASQH